MAEIVERHVLPELRPWVWPWLNDYQRDGIGQAVARGNHHIWWPCGSGKTAAAITWIVASPAPALVVTRASVRRQWASELRRFTTCKPYVLLPASERRKGWTGLEAYLAQRERLHERPIIIAGWPSLATDDGLNAEIADFVTRTERQPLGLSIVWDESHTAKNHKRWKRLPQEDGSFRFERLTSTAAVAGFLAPLATRRLALTATPMPDRTRDLWAQLDIVDPGCAGKYWDWAKEYCGAYEDQHGWDDRGASDLDILREWCNSRASIVSTEQVSTKLPPLRRTVTYLSPDVLERPDRSAKAAIRHAAKVAGGGTGTEDKSAAALLLQARLEAAAAMKGKHVAQTVLDCVASGQKVLVFTGRRVDVTKLETRIRKKLPHDVPLWAADGSTPPDERERIREAYMAHKGAAVIVGTGAAWGESANLHDTDRLLIVMLPWTWGQLRQWEGRVRRLGGRNCLIEYLIAEETIDERIASIVLSKLAAVEAILPDEQVAAVRESLQGGTDDDLLDGILDRILDS